MKDVFRSSWVRTAWLGGSVAALTLLGGCDRPTSSPTTPGQAPEVFLAVAATGSPATMTLGDTTSLVPYSRFAQNKLGEGIPLTWRSTNTSIVAVNGSGTAIARGVGSARVIVATSKRADTIPVTVRSAGTVTRVQVSLNPTAINVGETSSVVATALDASGQPVTGVTFTYASSAPAVAAVSANGTVSGLSAGSATISASVGSVTGSAGITVSVPPPSGGSVTAPNPPAIYAPQYPVVTGKSWIVKPTDNLQAILNQAQRGDEIVLPAGATFTGNFILPAKPGTAANGWILVRSDRTLPARGTRVTPAHASLMPKLVTATVYPAVATATAASGWWLSGIEFAVDPSLTAINYGLITLGDGSTKQWQLSQVPSDLVIERSYVHGAPSSRVSRCVALNSARTALMDSYVHECHLQGFDSQAIAGWNGPGPFKIVNNTLAGAGENIMFGGSDPAIPNLIPSDIEIRRNYIYTPASWKGVWTKMNLLESKNSQRVLVEGNVLDGSWKDAQVGYAVLLKSANQSGRCTWCATRDWHFRYNIVRNAGGGFNLAGLEGSNPHPVGERLTRVRLEHNLVDGINTGIYVGDSKMVQVLQDVNDLSLRNNSFFSTSPFTSVLNVGSKPAGTDFEMIDNAGHFGSYGLFYSATGPGEAALSGFRGSVTYRGQVFVGQAHARFPTTLFVSSLAAIPAGHGVDAALLTQGTAGVVIP